MMQILLQSKFNFHQVQFLLSSIILFLNQLTANANRFNCPPNSIIRPCVCHEKSKGLDFNCEGANLNQLKEAIDGISTNGQTVYYLKIKKSINFNVFPSYLLDGIKITHLILYHNNLTSIEQEAFMTTFDNPLISLDLSFNQLKKVPTHALQTLSSLISLNLNYNEIEYINEYAFNGLVSLLSIYLFGNKIKQIDANSFTGTTNLTRINLGGNLLNSVPTHCLQSLQTLNRLHLHENRIASLESDLFVNFIASDTLDTLILNKNQIKVIPDRAFKYLVGLNSLEIISNEINLIQNDAFHQIEESLEWIKLSENHLTDIPRSLKNLTKLRLLDLRSNRITHVSKSAFFNFGKSLTYLHLQKNRIMVIEDGAFDELKSLEWLYLSSNRLFTLSPELFRPIILPKRLKVLDIHDNPFICNCELSWLSDWIQSKEGASIINLPKQTKCKLDLISTFEGQDKNKQSLFNDLENLGKLLNYSFAKINQNHRNYLEMTNKKKSLGTIKDEIPLGEMNKCSSSLPSQKISYKYHLYCLVLSFIMVHIIYYYLGFLFHY